MDVRVAILGVEIPSFWGDFHWIPTCKKTAYLTFCAKWQFDTNCHFNVIYVTNKRYTFVHCNGWNHKVHLTHVMNHCGFFVWGKLTFSCNEYTCLMSAKHQSWTQYQDHYIIVHCNGWNHKVYLTCVVSDFCVRKTTFFVVISHIETGKKLAITLGRYRACTGTRSAIASGSYQPGSVLHTNLNTTCKSTYQTNNTGHDMQNADWLRNHCDPQCSVPYLQMQGLFWSYFKYQRVCVIPFSNHDWKQTTSLYHVILHYSLWRDLKLFVGFRVCYLYHISPCTLVAKRVEVVPFYTCY